MTNKYKIDFGKDENEKNEKISEISKRVRAIIGVPENFLENEVIVSPVFITKTESYINKYIKDLLELIDENNLELLNIASIYYISYLLCIGMDARLPKQMENISTKTVLQSINWDEKALELLDRANEIMYDFIEEYNEDENYYSSFAELSTEQNYPEENI